ncbi:hypothetical protein IT570_02865 [Candidatus Sumerlaeota bacterium]|nr:hypothetical protein [Candidatus Sumerlaeota bacterium]
MAARARARKTTSKATLPASQQEWLKDELATLNRAYAKAMKSPKSARAFLQKAGVLNEKGELAKSYRDSN